MMPRRAQRLGQFAQAEAEVCVAFVATRLLVCLLAWFAYSAFPHGAFPGLPSARPWNLLYHWDALWYGRIVQRGYAYTVGEASSVNFFPLYPLLVGGFRKLTGAWTPFAGFVISNAALLGAGVCLRRLVQLDFGERIPLRAVWLLFLCPATFFHSAVYPESLFLLLSLGAVLLARKGEWAGSGLAGALLTASHGNALLILLPLGWEALRKNQAALPNESWAGRLRRSRAWLFSVPLGIVCYAVYLQIRFGDALAFGHSQRAFYRELTWPWAGFAPVWQTPTPEGILQVAAAAAGIFILLLAYRVRLRVGYQLYALAMLLLTLSTSFLTATPRLLCEAFPFYIALAAATREREGVFALTLGVSAAIMALCLALFVCGYAMV